MKTLITIRRTDKPTPPTDEIFSGYVCKFTAQGGNENPYSEPAVTPSQWKYQKFGTFVWFTEELQRLSWGVTEYTNPLMSSMNWASVWAGDTWGTNNNGWDNESEPADQRHDYINNRYTTYPLPKVMDAIVFAGGLYRFQDRGDGHLWAIPGWSGIDVNKPLPSVQEIIEKRWYFRAVINPREGGEPYDFAQGRGHPNGVIIPYFLKEEVPYTKEYFEWYEGTQLPKFMQVVV